ncbi:MAG: molybdenum cofactor biosynthesis protein MoaE [Chryseolinea sp.]
MHPDGHCLGWPSVIVLGTLWPGETAVVVAVSTPHRKDSFEACQFIIDSLKEHIPIWKKEDFERDEEWYLQASYGQ